MNDLLFDLVLKGKKVFKSETHIFIYLNNIHLSIILCIYNTYGRFNTTSHIPNDKSSGNVYFFLYKLGLRVTSMSFDVIFIFSIKNIRRI